MTVNKIFQSQWPQNLEPTTYSSIKNVLWNTVTVLTGSSFLHDQLASIINPAAIKNAAKSIELDQLRSQLVDPQGKFKAEIVQLQAADGTLIEGAFFPGSSKQVILFAIGSGGRYEAVADPKDAAHDFVQFFREKLGMNVLVINTRGVEHSENKPSLQGSSLDYYTAWNYLESKELKVLPWGHSLGFRYIVEAAAWKQQENPDKKIDIVSDRSFDDLANEAKQAMGGGITGSIVGGLTQYAGWGGNVQASWNSLKGKKLIFVAPEDKAVPYQTASFHKRIKANAEPPEATVIKLRGAENAHTRIYNEQEGQAITQVVSGMFL